MDNKLLNAYRAARLEDGGCDGSMTPARHALRSARYKLKTDSRNLPRYAGDSVNWELPHGESISVALEPDYDCDITDRLGVTVEIVGRYSDWPECSDWWQGRDGVVYFTSERRGDRYTFRDDYGFDQMRADRARSMSRHDAYLAARAAVDRSASYYREAMDAGYYGYVVTLHDADGEEIEADSCWGFEATGDYAADEAGDAAEYMMRKRAEYWTARIASTRDEMRDLRDTVRNLVAEMKRLHNLDAPTACRALRSQLAEMRKRHSACARVIAG